MQEEIVKQYRMKRFQKKEVVRNRGRISCGIIKEQETRRKEKKRRDEKKLKRGVGEKKAWKDCEEIKKL